MSKALRNVLFWAPRGLALLLAAFVSVFALDVFGQGYSLGETLVALTIHLVPTFMLLFALVLGWRWEWLGSVLFIALGLGYVLVSGGRMHWTAYLLIAGPCILIGALFSVGWRHRAQIRG